MPESFPDTVPAMPPARYERDGDVAEIVISAPPLNLFGPDLFSALEAAVERAAAERPRGLLVRAEGTVFSAGGDRHGFEGRDEARAPPGSPDPRRGQGVPRRGRRARLGGPRRSGRAGAHRAPARHHARARGA